MKIGIIRLSSLGDVVLATAVLKPLRAAYPGAEIVFVVRSNYVDVLKNNSYLNRVIAWEKDRPFKGFLSSVREEHFDLLLDLHSTARSHSIAAFSGAGRVIRYAKSHVARRISLVTKKRPRTRHVVERYMDAVRMLGIEASDSLPGMYPGKEDLDWVEAYIGEHGYAGGPLVCIAPGARRPTKRWSAQRFGRLSSELMSNWNVGVVMVGDHGDIEVSRPVLAENPGVIDAVGQTDIGKLGALLSRSSLVISNDSAPVHIAVATGTPVVAIFGPTVVEFGFAPYGEGNAVVSRKLYCRPCSLHGTRECPEGHFRCMQEIEWNDVYNKAAGILETRLEQ